MLFLLIFIAARLTQSYSSSEKCYDQAWVKSASSDM